VSVERRIDDIVKTEGKMRIVGSGAAKYRRDWKYRPSGERGENRGDVELISDSGVVEESTWHQRSIDEEAEETDQSEEGEVCCLCGNSI